MQKAISYSLFGYGKKRYEGCFTFDSYLSSLMLSIRFNKLVLPNWTTVVQVNKKTYDGFETLFRYLDTLDNISINIEEKEPELCEGMLWRMKPLFQRDKKGEFRYSHVLCRDLDSLHTYREAQAIKVWVDNNKGAHAITDSVSHTIPMMGGMIGFKSCAFLERTEYPAYEEMIRHNNYDLSKKGADQLFLNKIIYPKFSQMGNDSITQHYFKGHANTWLSDFHTCDCWLYSCGNGHTNDCKENVPLSISDDLKETNEVSEHMGAAGYNQTQTMNIVEKYKEQFKEFEEVEKQHPNIFTWTRT